MILIIYLLGAVATTIQIVREDSIEPGPEWVRTAVAAILIIAWPLAWIIVIIHQIRMNNLH